MNTDKRLTKLILFALLFALTACGAGLPRRFQNALDEHITTLDASDPAYEVLSAQTPASAGDTFRNLVSTQPSASGACPPAGIRELWCVVISPPVTDSSGTAYAHFLLRQQGRYMDVEPLADDRQDAFVQVGCDNWDTSH
jgi:hypothetical protein